MDKEDAMYGDLTLRRSLADAVTVELKEMILRGDVPPGGWLPPQPELANRFGVGLSTVREAIRGLSFLGILQPQPGRGTQVSPEARHRMRLADLIGTRLQKMDILAFHEARRVLEVGLVRLAAKKRDQQDMEEIKDVVERMRQELNNASDFAAADLDFHVAVARTARNELLESCYHVARSKLADFLEQVVRIPEIRRSSLALQQDIVTAINKGDTAAAQQSAEALMDHVGELLSAFLSARDPARTVKRPAEEFGVETAKMLREVDASVMKRLRSAAAVTNQDMGESSAPGSY